MGSEDLMIITDWKFYLPFFWYIFSFTAISLELRSYDSTPDFLNVTKIV